MEPMIYKPSIHKGAGIYKVGAEGGGGGVVSIPNMSWLGAFQNGNGLLIQDNIFTIAVSNQRAGFYPITDTINFNNATKIKYNIKALIKWYEYAYIFGRGFDVSDNGLTRLFRAIYQDANKIQFQFVTNDGSSFTENYEDIINTGNLGNNFHNIGVEIEKQGTQTKCTWIFDATTKEKIFNYLPSVDNLIIGIGKQERNQLSNNFYYGTKIDYSNTYIELDGNLIWGNKE